MDLRNNNFPKTKAPIINENTPYYSNISKLKTKAQTKNKNNSKNKRYRNSTKKIKLKRKLFLNDNMLQLIKNYNYILHFYPIENFFHNHMAFFHNSKLNF